MKQRTAKARRRWCWLMMVGTVCLLPPFISAQPVEGLPQTIGARGHALAGAVSTESNDVTGMFWNPATLALLRSSQIVVGALHAPENGLLNVGVALPLFLPGDNVLGLSVLTSRETDLDRLRLEREYRRMNASMAAGARLTSTASAGLLVQAERLWTGQADRWNGSMTGGLLYAPSPEIAYALVYRSAGIRMGVIDEVARSDSLFFSPLERMSVLHMAITMRYPSARFRRLFQLTMANEKAFGETGIRYFMACEVFMTRWLSCRVGAQFIGSTVSTGWGVGWAFESFKAEYSYASAYLPVRFHEITLSFGLQNQEDSGRGLDMGGE